ncbi:MAG: glycosyltransferase [Burkholderiales bacterium]|nr:glycosyltransferase [Opitutaceae bacterium]
MRILVHDYAGHAFPVDLSRELARRGHTVCHAYASNLVTPRGDLASRPADPAGLQFKELPMDARYPKWKYSFAKRRGLEVAYGRAAGVWIHQFHPELVISGNTPTDSQIHLLRATEAVGGRFISWVQDFYGIAVEKLVRKKLGPLGWPVGAYYRWLDRRILRASDHTVVITDDFIPLVMAEGVPFAKITSIPNWAIINELSVQPKDNPWSRRQDLHDKFVFLYTGTLGMKHNPELLSGLAMHFRDTPEVRVVVVSEGPGADWLKQTRLHKNLTNLILLPYQPFKELPALLGSGDVLVAVLEPDAGVFSVPSKVLGYLCASRAMLLAMPTENLAARMVLVAGAGVVVPPGEAAAFQAAARVLHGDPASRAIHGRSARNFAEASFGISGIADRFETACGIAPCP